jgi:hypothetical protein
MLPFEDEVITSHPDTPTHDYNDIHEERRVELLSK